MYIFYVELLTGMFVVCVSEDITCDAFIYRVQPITERFPEVVHLPRLLRSRHDLLRPPPQRRSRRVHHRTVVRHPRARPHPVPLRDEEYGSAVPKRDSGGIGRYVGQDVYHLPGGDGPSWRY